MSLIRFDSDDARTVFEVGGGSGNRYPLPGPQRLPASALHGRPEAMSMPRRVGAEGAWG